MYEVGNFVAGVHRNGDGSRKSPLFNPATGEQVGNVRLSDSVDVDAAVDAAHTAFRAWAETPIMKRVAIMFRFRELLNQNRDQLCEAIVREHGKSVGGCKW